MNATEQIRSKMGEGILISKDIDTFLSQFKKENLQISDTDTYVLTIYKIMLDKLLNVEEGHISFSVRECNKLNLNLLKLRKFLEEPEINGYVKKLHQAAFGGFIIFEVIDKSKFKEFLYQGINTAISKIQQE